MSEFEKEHLKDIQSNCFWAGYLNDLPKDTAWQVADEIVEAVQFALKQANGADKSTDKALRINSVINWVACSERLPEGALGSYLACLENNTVHKLQYSDMTKHWRDIAMGDIKPQNPVKYWAELPEPPCL